MQTVAVIPVNDRPIKDIDTVKSFPASTKRRGFDFALNDLGRVRDLDRYSDFVRTFDSLTGPAVIFLDLELGDVLDDEQVGELTAFPSTMKAEKALAGGVHLLNLLVEQREWFGVILITTDQTKGIVQDLLEEEVRKKLAIFGRQATGTSPVVIEFRPHGGITKEGAATTALNEAIGLFLKAGDPVAWYLDPPLKNGEHSKSGRNLGWFEGEYHEPGSAAYTLHLDAVKKRYPKWKLDTWVKSLMESAERPVDHARRRVGIGKGVQIPWENLKDFLGEDLSTTLANGARITLPTQPAFPFLQAAADFFCAVRETIGDTPAVLEHFKTASYEDELTVLFLGIQHEGQGWSLWRAGWQNVANERTGRKDEGGKIGEAFLRALDARPECDESMVKSAPLGGVFDGLPGAAVPWITPQRVGVSWCAAVVEPQQI